MCTYVFCLKHTHIHTYSCTHIIYAIYAYIHTCIYVHTQIHTHKVHIIIQILHTVSKLSADHCGLFGIPTIITNCAISVVVAHKNCALTGISGIYRAIIKKYLAIITYCRKKIFWLYIRTYT